MVIVLTVLLVTLSNTYAAEQPEKQSPQKTVDQNETQQTKLHEPEDANEPREPNEGLKPGPSKDLRQLNLESQEEIREWNNIEPDNKPRLMRAINKRLQMEYQMLRKIALEEGAEKTAAAIDDLIEKSNQRYEQAASNLEEEKRQTRLEQLREERQQKLEEKKQKREERRKQRQKDRDDRSERRP